MVDYAINYDVIDRLDWAQLTTPVAERATDQITPTVLEQIKAFNDQISLDDVMVIYQPLVSYIQLRYAQYQRDLAEQQLFLGRPQKKLPFVIGIAGSVAVGKTTTARLLQVMLQAVFGNPDEIALMTTDGFLLPNEELAAQGLMARKGFPESYDMTSLLNFMQEVKEGVSPLRAPRYSHDTNDVLQGEVDQFDSPKILIVEGINTLQLTPGSLVYVADYFDLSIYVDAETALIKQWYLDRFEALLDQTARRGDESNFFWEYTKMARSEAVRIAADTWEKINLPNLQQYIKPTRERADLVLHKAEGHLIDQIWLRK